MGLISFLRDKGRQIFGKKEKEQTEAVAKTKTQLLKEEIDRLGLNVRDLQLEICEQVIATGTVQDTATAERVVLALGNVEGVGSVDNQLNVLNPEPEARWYTVESGDSLSKISKEMYGDPMQYEKIFDANRPMLEHPDKIYPGQKLRIPA